MNSTHAIGRPLQDNPESAGLLELQAPLMSFEHG